MKVIMTLKEKMAIETANKYKQWDYIIPAKESYLQAIQDVLEFINGNSAISRDSQNVILDKYNETVEVEFKDGSHQLYNKDKK